MVYYITGTNLFGQWLCDDVVLNEFQYFTAIKNDLGFSLSRANILDINWSYNIIEIDGTLFITGAWHGKEQQLIKLPLPSDCFRKIKFTAVGNDNNVVLIAKDVNKIWVIDLNNKNEIKKINFLAEKPIEDSTKKQKVDDNILKLVITNDSCLYLTTGGNVYSGILPTFVDTSHCKGKINDIQCGYEHFLLLTEEGRVYTWGNGRRLQLGHGNISNEDLPTEVDALAGIKIIKISAGGWHSLALSVFGDVYAWGWNDTGQLGIKNLNKDGPESYSVPTLVDVFDEHEEQVLKNITDIACGTRHSALMLDDNTIWTTGCNKYGQCGFSEKKNTRINHFKRAFQCDAACSLMCGPWNTVIYQ